MKFIWDKCIAGVTFTLVTIPNRYQGLILFIMLLAIYYK